jgi:hypothetical protein
LNCSAVAALSIVCTVGLARSQVQDAGASEVRKTWALGQRVADDIVRKDGAIDDQAIVGYLQSLGSRISAVAGAKALEIRVTHGPSEYALLLPNGDLVISGGLLERIENEASLAGLLAHEIVHSQRSEKKTLTPTGVPLHRPLCVFGVPLISLAWSGEMHEEESQVMALAVSILTQGGFDPLPGLELLSKLVYEHPSWGKAIPTEDILSLRAAAESKDPPTGGYTIDTSSFQQNQEAIAVALGHRPIRGHAPSLNPLR